MSRRSSLFWLPDTNIDKSSLLIYFSVGNTEVESVITKLKKHNLQWVNIKKWYNLENHHLADNIIKSIRRTNSNDNIHKLLTYEICNLIYNVTFTADNGSIISFPDCVGKSASFFIVAA